MLEIKNLKKSYDGNIILQDINLNIEEGEIVSILGPSGCGKPRQSSTESGVFRGSARAGSARVFCVMAS